MGIEDKIINSKFDLDCPYAKQIIEDSLAVDCFKIECELKPFEILHQGACTKYGLCDDDDYFSCYHHKNEIYRMIL